MPDIWKSRIIYCDVKNGIDKDNTDSIVIPRSGWYGFFFGRRNEHGFEESNEENDICLESAGWCLMVLSQSQPTPPCAIGLPLIETGKPLLHTSVGRLIYLPKDCIVRVNPQPNYNLSQQCYVNSIQWSILFHRMIDTVRGEKEPSTPSESLQMTLQKKIVCRECARSFISWEGVINHRLQTHRKDYISQSIATPIIWQKELEVVYQDTFLAVVVKPQGMPVQGDKHTLCRSDLLRSLSLPRDTVLLGWPAGEVDTPLTKPRPAHRLDSATGGLLVLAKTRLAESKLKQSFAERNCQKNYLALVHGKMTLVDGEEDGTVNATVQNKPSETKYRIVRHCRSSISKDGWLTVVDLRPLTGRKHQLRKHMKVIGHPIWGDHRYGGKNLDVTIHTQSRLCLWAMQITIPHPVTGEEKTMQAPHPDWLDYVIQEEEHAWDEENEKHASLQVDNTQVLLE
jgi:23S rRNA pseudouridine1911/1915/1917 synthase